MENEKLLEVLFENINMDRRVSIMVVHETFNFGYSGSILELCTKIWYIRFPVGSQKAASA